MIIYGVPPGNVFFGGLVDPPTSADYFFVKLTGIAGFLHCFNSSLISTFCGGSKPPPYRKNRYIATLNYHLPQERIASQCDFVTQNHRDGEPFPYGWLRKNENAHCVFYTVGIAYSSSNQRGFVLSKEAYWVAKFSACSLTCLPLALYFQMAYSTNWRVLYSRFFSQNVPSSPCCK